MDKESPKILHENDSDARPEKLIFAHEIVIKVVVII